MFVIVCSLYTVAGVEDRCPHQCDCEELSDGGIRIICSSKQLLELPEVLPHNTTELLLNDNEIISSFEDSFSNCTLLRLLDLSRNKLNQLSENSFSSANNIELLYLNDNNIEYDHLPEYIFRQLTVLRVLHLHNNNWKTLTSYPGTLFAELISVEFLTLDRFPGAMFGDVFSEMVKLNIFHIYGGLDAVRNDTFSSFCNSSVTELSIKTKTSLYRLEAASFKPFSKLKSLDLGSNQNLGFHNVSDAWWGLQYTNVTKLVLTNIVSGDDQLTVSLTDTFFKYLNLSQIETLLINKNNIVSIYSGWSAALPHIIHLDVSYNRISLVTVVGDIIFLKKLKYLDWSQQDRRFVGNGETRRVKHEQGSTVENNDDWFANHCQLVPFEPCRWKPPDVTGT